MKACINCGGLIIEPGETVGYTGKICYCGGQQKDNTKGYEVCYAKPQEWTEVVEDALFLNIFGELRAREHYLFDLCEKYLAPYKGKDIPVRIKCREGMIQIERLKGVGK